MSAGDDGLECATSASGPQHWVYKAYDAEDELLYVGITMRGHRRLSEHARFSGWRDLVQTIQIEHLPDRESALEREAHLIKTLYPAFNIMLRTSRRFPDPPLPEPEPEAEPETEPEPRADGLMTLRDAGILLSVSDSVLKKCIQTDGLPAIWDGDQHLVDPDDLEIWIGTRKKAAIR